MDPVTHAASGAVAMLALGKHPATLWSLPLAALACAAPDTDLAFIHTPLEFLQLHRGITHSFAGAPVLGFILTLLAWPLWRPETPGRWTFRKTWLFCTGMVLLHIWLDVVTTYGTMVFLPFSHYRVRLNSIFIIDFLVTLPLLWALWRWRRKRALILAVLAWTFFYPASGIAVNAWHTEQWKQRLGTENRQITGMAVLPDAFTPFFWRVIYEERAENGRLAVVDQSINILGEPRAPAERHVAALPALAKKIADDSIAGGAYFSFAMLPVMQELRAEDRPEHVPPNASLLMFYDLRFGSGLQFVRKILAMRPNADLPFQLMAELSPAPGQSPGDLAATKVDRIRLRFPDSGRDSSWHRPLPPRRPDLWQWLVGLN